MLDFCAEHGIVSDVEMIPMDQIDEAYERMLAGDVKYRFVIDMASMPAAASPPRRRVGGVPEEHAEKAVRARSFGAAADAYERARPSYPDGRSTGCCPAGRRPCSTSAPGPAS